MATLIRQFRRSICVCVVLLLVLIVFFLGWQNWHLKQNKSPNQNDKLISAIAQHLLLPSNEIPTIGIIQDSEKLKDQQSFFVNAQNGDYLLMYTQTGKAIIYRPDQDLVVNVGPISFTTTSDSVNLTE